MKTIAEASHNVNVRSVTGAIMLKRTVLTATKKAIGYLLPTKYLLIELAIVSEKKMKAVPANEIGKLKLRKPALSIKIIIPT